MLSTLLRSDRVDFGNGCGYDGIEYCGMAEGRTAALPYVRRVLAPMLVQLMPSGTTLDRFLLLDIAAIVASAVLAFLLVRQQHPSRGVTTGAGIIVVALLVSTPWTWHLSRVYPALTDLTALAFGLSWLYCITRNPAAAAFVAAGAVLARESWLPTVLLVVAFLGLRRVVQARHVVLHVLIAGLAARLAFTRPGTPFSLDTGPSPR